MVARFVRFSGRHDPGDFCATIWIRNLSSLYLTTLDRAFYDLDGDSCASGQATAASAPAIIYFVFHAFLSL